MGCTSKFIKSDSCPNIEIAATARIDPSVDVWKTMTVDDQCMCVIFVLFPEISQQLTWPNYYQYPGKSVNIGCYS